MLMFRPPVNSRIAKKETRREDAWELGCNEMHRFATKTVVCGHIQAKDVLRGPIVTWVIFLPMAAFEVPFALWLPIRGVAVAQLKSVAVWP
jgi:hypothetical protein